MSAAAPRRTIWKGFLQLSLVTVPVRLYAAIQEHRVQFHQLHKEDRGLAATS